MREDNGLILDLNDSRPWKETFKLRQRHQEIIKEMKFHKVKSSMATGVAHKDDTLFVQFNSGKVYEYPGITDEQYTALKDSESFGKHLNAMKATGHERKKG